MSNHGNIFEQKSPFHDGEKEMQSRTGMSERMDSIGGKIIRSYMPDQHRLFFSKLPFMIIGSVDEHGWPWASIITGKHGFIVSPSPTSLVFSTQALAGDPLVQNIQVGKPLGLLGIEFSSRRRNRLNAHISHATTTSFSASVDQSFGNCPQYIQTRTVEYTAPSVSNNDTEEVSQFSNLDEHSRHWIANTDTFFVSSYIPANNNPDTEGVDVSHRGGQPGFIKVTGNTLTIPDFSGNSLFMTLGNFIVNPKAGLIFIDFQSGDLMMLTGTVEVLSEGHEDLIDLPEVERGWKFKLEKGLQITNALPFRFVLDE